MGKSDDDRPDGVFPLSGWRPSLPTDATRPMHTRPMHTETRVTERPQTHAEGAAPQARPIGIIVNGEPKSTRAPTLATLIDELDFAGLRVATAVNGDFVPAGRRASCELAAGDRIEIVSARQGG